MENIELDVHTHTIASGHAYSSLSEMVAGAKEKDIKLLGIVEHEAGTIEENTRAVIETIKNPHISVIVHPDDGKCPLDYEKVVLAAKKYHTLLEVNNNALRSPSRLNSRENTLKMLQLCKQHRVKIILGSDAHIHFDIKNYDQIDELLKEVEFPKELIVNYHIEDFLEYIKKQVRY